MAYIVKPEVRATLRKARIGDLPENPFAAAVYVRSTGQLHLRINERYHCPALVDADGNLVGDGMAEVLNPMEEVEVVCTKEEPLGYEKFLSLI